MSSETGENYQVLDAITVDKIDHFLKPKRRSEAFFTLEKLGELSQKDLADAIGITATALSNILVVFTKFEIELLTYKNIGKYRFYSLSPVGQAYCKAKKSITKIVEGETSGESTKLIYEARLAIGELVNLSPLSWENIISSLLEKRVYGRLLRDVKGRYGLDDEDIDKAEQLLDQYIRCIEKAELSNNDVAVDKVLEFIPNLSIREQISDIVELFNKFSFVVRVQEDPKKAIKSYLYIKKVFSSVGKLDMSSDLEETNSDTDSFASIRKTAQDLSNITRDMDEESVCQYLLGIMPGQTCLCAYIARCICAERQ